MVVMGVLRIASLIFVAASTLPPNVSISNIKAFAFGCSLILLSTKEESPNSIVPLIGIIYTDSWAGTEMEMIHRRRIKRIKKNFPFSNFYPPGFSLV